MNNEFKKGEEFWTMNDVQADCCDPYQVYEVNYVDEDRGILLRSPIEAIWTELENDVCVVKYRHPVKGECRLSDFDYRHEAIACIKAIIKSRMWYKK